MPCIGWSTMKNKIGVVYLVHFSKAFFHARHYMGFCESTRKLDDRFEYHEKGLGSKLIAAAVNQGITFSLVRLWRGTRTDERNFKKMKCGPHYCPICSGHKRTRRGVEEIEIYIPAPSVEP